MFSASSCSVCAEWSSHDGSSCYMNADMAENSSAPYGHEPFVLSQFLTPWPGTVFFVLHHLGMPNYASVNPNPNLDFLCCSISIVYLMFKKRSVSISFPSTGECINGKQEKIWLTRQIGYETLSPQVITIPGLLLWEQSCVCALLPPGGWMRSVPIT